MPTPRQFAHGTTPWTNLAALCAMSVLLAGCGNSTGKTTRKADAARIAPAPQKASATASAPAPVASSARSGIRGRVLTPNELAGFRPAGLLVYETVGSWLAGEQQSGAQGAVEKAMLDRDGFRAGAVENLTSTSREGLSLAMQLRSPQAAHDALSFYVASFKAPGSAAGAYAPFKVTGIPGAVGYSLGGASGGINIAFNAGDYYVLVGREGGDPTAIANLSAAARHLYGRVRR